MDHAILTRFNVPSAGAECVIRARPGWLHQRVHLFETYCLPSVRAQTCRNFRWLIYFDPDSPSWLRDRVEGHAEAGYYAPVYRMSVSRDDQMADLRALFGRTGDELITTNLDNDDAFARDTLARLQEQPRPAGPTAYFFVDGLVRSPAGLYLRRDRDNAFPTVREPWGPLQTCWADAHNRLVAHMPVVELAGPPAWLQVVHETNVSNRTRGRLVDPAPYTDRFAGLLTDVPVPAARDVVLDRLVHRPRRMARDSSRVVAKTVARRLLGTGGFERAKQLVAERRSA